MLFTSKVYSDHISVISLNLCTDQLVFEVADFNQIISLTYLSSNEKLSSISSKVKTIKKNRGIIDEIIIDNPDIIFSSKGNFKLQTKILKKLNYKIVEIPIIKTFDDLRKQIRVISYNLHQTKKGEKIIKNIDYVLNKTQKNQKKQKSILVLNPNGYTSGTKTLLNEIILKAGHLNEAGNLGISGFGKLSLEKLAIANPDILIFDSDIINKNSLANKYLNHKIIKKLKNKSKVIYLNSKIWTCGTIRSVEFVELLSKY